MRSLLLTALLLAAAVAAACETEEAAPPAESPTPAPGGGPQESTRLYGELLVALRLDATSYRQGDAVRIGLTVTNDGDAAVTLHYRDSQRYDFELSPTDEAPVAWRWSDGKAFAQALGEERLEPGEALTYEETWDQRGSDGRPLAPGRYQLRGVVVGCRDDAFTECDLASDLPLEIAP